MRLLAAWIWLLTAAPALAQQPTVHRLTSTPETVVFGYYDAAVKPVLRIRSGDVVEITPSFIASPEMLEEAGVAPSDIKQSLRDIHAQSHCPGYTPVADEDHRPMRLRTVAGHLI